MGNSNPHLINGDFQSDKYPTTPLGKVPLSTKDPMAQDLLAEYARRRRAVDTDFADALEAALANHSYTGARIRHVVSLPAKIDDDLVEILGMPNFKAAPIAHAFKADGAQLEAKAEVEQAFVIHWLLRLWAQHGVDWRLHAGTAIGSMIERVKAKARAKAGSGSDRDEDAGR